MFDKYLLNRREGGKEGKKEGKEGKKRRKREEGKEGRIDKKSNCTISVSNPCTFLHSTGPLAEEY
jgi:hypothetical protein